MLWPRPRNLSAMCHHVSALPLFFRSLFALYPCLSAFWLWPNCCQLCVRSLVFVWSLSAHLSHLCPLLYAVAYRSLYTAWLCLCPLFVWSPLQAVLLSALRFRRVFAPAACFPPWSGFAVFNLSTCARGFNIEFSRAIFLCSVALRRNHHSLGLW